MAFQSNLLASLATLSYEPEMNTPEDVLASRMTVIVASESVGHRIMKSTDNPILKAIFEELIIERNGTYNYLSQQFNE